MTVETALSIAQRLSARAAAGAPQEPAPRQQIFLPVFLRPALPNAFARAALFSPLGSGRRRLVENELIASRSDVKILFSGTQLCMSDNDVFLQCLLLARGKPLGTRVKINRSRLLVELGKCDSGNNYRWLDSSIRRLLAATIVVQKLSTTSHDVPIRNSRDGSCHTKVLGIHLIQRFEFDSAQNGYVIEIPADIHRLFDGNAFTLIDWEKRMQLRERVAMAKWLQNYAASHAKGATHKIGIESLHAWTGLKSPRRKFRASLLSALRELERVGVLCNSKIKTNGVVEWWRPL